MAKTKQRANDTKLYKYVASVSSKKSKKRDCSSEFEFRKYLKKHGFVLVEQ